MAERLGPRAPNGATEARLLGNKDLTDALLSRLRHHCQTIHINEPSLREPQG